MVIIDLIKRRFQETKLNPVRHRMFTFDTDARTVLGCCAMGVLVFDANRVPLWNATSPELVGLIKDRHDFDINVDDIQDIMSGWDNTAHDFGLEDQPLSVAAQQLYKELTCTR